MNFTYYLMRSGRGQTSKNIDVFDFLYFEFRKIRKNTCLTSNLHFWPKNHRFGPKNPPL